MDSIRKVAELLDCSKSSLQRWIEKYFEIKSVDRKGDTSVHDENEEYSFEVDDDDYDLTKDAAVLVPMTLSESGGLLNCYKGSTKSAFVTCRMMKAYIIILDISIYLLNSFSEYTFP